MLTDRRGATLRPSKAIEKRRRQEPAAHAAAPTPVRHSLLGTRVVRVRRSLAVALLLLLLIAVCPKTFRYAFEARLGAKSSSPLKAIRQSTTGKGARLILHVGPPKSASSSVQCSLAELEKTGHLSAVLSAKAIELESCRPSGVEEIETRLDQYRKQFSLIALEPDVGFELNTLKKVVGGGSFLPHCMSREAWQGALDGTSDQPPKCWSQSYGAYIDNVHRMGRLKTFVVSNEMLTGALGQFGGNECEKVLNILLDSLPADSQLDIVYIHRYFFDMSKSMHSQEYDSYKRPRTNQWPPQGYAVPLLHEYIDQHGDRLQINVEANKCFRRASANNLRITFTAIDYNEDNILSDFFALMTDDPIMMNELVSLTKRTSRENTASMKQISGNAIPLDRVALAAYAHGLFPAGMTRPEARQLVKRHSSRTKRIKYKYTCPPSDFYDSLLEKSLMLQELIFPNDRPKKDQMTRAFRDAVRTNRLCDVDGEATLESNDLTKYMGPSLKKKKVPIVFREEGLY